MSIDITDQDVFGALRTFLLAVLPSGTEVVQGQDNQVAMPLGGFVTMNNTGMTRLATNEASYTPGTSNPGTKSVLVATQYTIQVDFYGPLSQSWAMQAQTLFRDEFATDLMPANIQPLYADDPTQMPLLDGEAQYEQRWKVSAVMQYNPMVTVPQNFGDTFPVTVNGADAVAPP